MPYFNQSFISNRIYAHKPIDDHIHPTAIVLMGGILTHKCLFEESDVPKLCRQINFFVRVILETKKPKTAEDWIAILAEIDTKGMWDSQTNNPYYDLYRKYMALHPELGNFDYIGIAIGDGRFGYMAAYDELLGWKSTLAAIILTLENFDL